MICPFIKSGAEDRTDVFWVVFFSFTHLCLLILAPGQTLNEKQGWKRAQREAPSESAYKHVHSSPGDVCIIEMQCIFILSFFLIYLFIYLKKTEQFILQLHFFGFVSFSKLFWILKLFNLAKFHVWISSKYYGWNLWKLPATLHLMVNPSKL